MGSFLNRAQTVPFSLTLNLKSDQEVSYHFGIVRRVVMEGSVYYFKYLAAVNRFLMPENTLDFVYAMDDAVPLGHKSTRNLSTNTVSVSIHVFYLYEFE